MADAPDAVLALAVAAIRDQVEDVAKRFEDVARDLPKGSPGSDALRRARRSTYEAKRVLDSLHILSRPPKPPSRVEGSVFLEQSVRAIKDVFATETVEIWEIVPQTLPPGIAEPTALRYAILNLVVAAVRACGGAGIVRVIGRQREGGGFLVEVSDEDGEAVSRDDRDAVFALPVAGERRSPLRRSALGLWLARRLAEHAGVTIEAVERGKGAAMVLAVPAAG